MKIVGGIGGAFLSISYTAATIAFNEASPDTIVDSAGQFLIKGFMPGMTVTITGSASNNKTITIASVTATTIILIAADDLTDEVEGATVTLASSAIGSQVLGMNNITLDDGIDVEDTTCFEDYPYETHETEFKTWTANIGGFWLTEAPRKNWVGKQLTFRFFLRTSASPSAGSPAVYYQGVGIVRGLPTDVPTRQLVKQSIDIVGNGQLSLVVKTDAW